jgi:hypothetical protein
MRQFQIESTAFIRIVALAFVGFAIHYFLPLRFRLPFFASLSLASIGIIFGVLATGWLLTLGGVLIGLCHLPVRLSIRVLLLLAAAMALALFRIDWLLAPWSPAIWPILGSMFMFRLLIYLYDLQHAEEPFSLARTISYFFMLPNVCFPMFPVVDYKTFRRTYFDSESQTNYQLGVNWITRGVVHLILYRLVYYYFTLSQVEVSDSGDLVHFILANFLLYLRISGQFHLIVGILRLFGFNLPETHHLYFLSSSFTDFWRRINIYWKDFMMKLFYYPVYFRLRKLGSTIAIVFSTLIVFFATWLLHAYQWFWLRGTLLFTGPDTVFWGILAVLVVANSLAEVAQGRERAFGKYSFNPIGFCKRSVKTFATFWGICALWSLWTSESIVDWIALWETALSLNTKAALLLASTLVVVAVSAEMFFYYEHKVKTQPVQNSLIFGRSVFVNVMLLGILSLTGVQEIYIRFGPTVATFVNSLRSGRLSRIDVAMLEKGYYENLNRVERFNSQLWELYMNRPATWLDVTGTGLERFTGDFLQKELVPSFVAFSNYGSVSTNRWAMRDQEYERVPPQNTYRIALLGASTVMGWGVGDDETFESLVEQRLNQDDRGRPYERYEILNFAVPGYQPLQQLIVMEKAISFKPNAIFYVATGREASRAAFYLAEAASKRISIPYEPLNEILRKALVEPGSSENVATRRLLPLREEILSWTYEKIVADSRKHGVVPVLIFLPQVEPGSWVEETPKILAIAKRAGFAVLDLSDVYRDHDLKTIRLADWDNHPNAKGHQLVATRLYALVKDNKMLSVALLTQKYSTP